ncbi:MAG: hypothetical protein R6V27_11530 [Balneolaceae bacterium]
MAIDRVLALVNRHKHKPSRAHRIIPYRFELLPEELAKRNYDGTEKLLILRMQPYRFRSGKIPSSQVIGLPTQHLEHDDYQRVELRGGNRSTPVLSPGLYFGRDGLAVYAGGR